MRAYLSTRSATETELKMSHNINFKFSSTSFLPSPTLFYKMDVIIDKNSDKKDNVGSKIDYNGTVDNHVNKKTVLKINWGL